VTVLDWGGRGGAIVFLHPNGFCAGLFHPIARLLVAEARVVGVDLSGHGGTDPPADHAGYRFDEFAADVVAALDHLGIERAAVVGESLGGGVGIVTDRLAPGRVAVLVLCEAIAFLGHGSEVREAGNPLAAAARRRRAIWPDRATMVRSYATRPPLDELAPEALEAYVRWGTRDLPDGRVALRCTPEVEATIFESSAGPGGASDAWEHLGHLSCPAVVLRGSRSDLPGEWFEAQARRAGAPLRTVEGGHFFLHRDTARGASLVREAIAAAGP
jgi:pimeloyl-ACP methyl ester carboxylesterase